MDEENSIDGIFGLQDVATEVVMVKNEAKKECVKEEVFLDNNSLEMEIEIKKSLFMRTGNELASLECKLSGFQSVQDKSFSLLEGIGNQPMLLGTEEDPVVIDSDSEQDLSSVCFFRIIVLKGIASRWTNRQ